MKTLAMFLAIAVLVFRVLCLNYTKGTGFEHHREWAVQHGLSAPNEWIYRIGVLSTLVGGGALGFVVGSRTSTRRRRAPSA